MDEPVTVRPATRSYPLDRNLTVMPLTGAALVLLLKIEHGRVIEPEVFGSMHVDQGMSQLRTRKAEYLVATEGDRTLGAVGYVFDERNRSVRIVELIGQDEAVKGSLLRLAVEAAESTYVADLIKCDASTHSLRLQ